MQRDEARILLGFPRDSRPTLAQIKEAYRKKVWESHPDLFPGLEKAKAESKFKLVSEAYTSLLHEGTALYLERSGMIFTYVHYHLRMREFVVGRRLDDTIFFDSAIIESILDDWLVESEKQEDEVCSHPGAGREGSASGTYSRVVRTGVPQAHGGGRSSALIRIPFLLIVLGTVGLGGMNASRAYRKQKEAYPSHNPFLP